MRAVHAFRHVGTDRGLAQGARHVGEQRDHMHAGAHQFVDRQLHLRHVGRQQGDTVEIGKLHQLGREHGGVRYRQAVRDFSDVLMAEFAGGLGDDAVDQIEEAAARRRQHEGETVVRGRTRAAAHRCTPPQLNHRLAHFVHGRRIHSGPAVEHPVDSGRTDASRLGDLGDGDRIRHVDVLCA